MFSPSLNITLIFSILFAPSQISSFQILNVIQMRGILVIACDPQGKLASPAEEATFTSEELKEYYKVYQDPDVKYLRAVFNAYLAGARDKRNEYKALREFDREYYKSKFVVLAVNGGLMGGNFITIIFQDRPDKIFKAWVYKKEQKYELRVFEPAKFDDNDVKRIQIRYRPFLRDKEHAM